MEFGKCLQRPYGTRIMRHQSKMNGTQQPGLERRTVKNARSKKHSQIHIRASGGAPGKDTSSRRCKTSIWTWGGARVPSQRFARSDEDAQNQLPDLCEENIRESMTYLWIPSMANVVKLHRWIVDAMMVTTFVPC